MDGNAGDSRRDEGSLDEEAAGLGPRGTFLVVTLVVAFLVVPAVIYWRPPELPFLVAFLVLPLLPAIGLGLVAVWSLTESNPREQFDE
jgi:hypothetical protein